MWQTVIYASSEGWIYISVVNDQARHVEVPRLAKSLLRELELGDAGVRLHSQVEVVTHRTVHKLLDIIESPYRKIPLFVAGSQITDDRYFEEFTEKVERWTSGIQGLGKIVALDKSATEFLYEHLDSFAPFTGTLRTYLPKVDTAVPSDAIRHRYLTWRNLEESDGRYAARIVKSIAREQAVDRLIDTELRSFSRSFSALENIHRIEERREYPAVSVQTEYQIPDAELSDPTDLQTPIETPESPQTDATKRSKTPRIFDKKFDGVDSQPESHIQASPVERITEAKVVSDTPPEAPEKAFTQLKTRIIRTLSQIANLVGLKKFRMDTFEARVVEMRDAQSDLSAYEDIFTEQDQQISNLEEANQDNEILLQLLEDDFNALDTENANLAEEIARLRNRLKANRQYKDMYPTKAPESDQRSASEILKNPPKGIVFTGKSKDVEEFEATDTNQNGTLTLSRSVKSMSEYLHARRDRRYTDSFDGFVNNTPQGYNCYIGPSKSVPTESRQTLQQFGSERTLMVPTSVVPSGQVEMRAHIRLMRGRSGNGRMHYYYDANSNKIFIGYVGAHLTNTLTN